MKKDCAPTDNCKTNKIRRPLYFHGMLLDEKSFRDEQEYHAQKRRLLNRMLYGSGVVCGLELTGSVGGHSLTLDCGLALDCAGREIFVDSRATLDIPKPPKPDAAKCPPGTPPKKEICYRILIAFQEQDSDYEQVLLPSGSCDDKTCKPTRKWEGFCFKFDDSCECPTPPDPKCDPKGSGLTTPLKSVVCGCGCSCTCHDEHWVTIGTVKVDSEGAILSDKGDPSGTILYDAFYECRDWVISAQMWKQLLTPGKAPANCDCPDHLRRLGVLLGVTCDVRKDTDDVTKEIKVVQNQVDVVLANRIKAVEKFEGRIKKLEDAAKR